MKKKCQSKLIMLPRIMTATLVLLLSLSVSLFGVAYSIRENIRQSCFESLEDATAETASELRVIFEKNRQHLTSLAALIGRQEDIHSPLVLSVLQSFDREEDMSDIGILYPDNQVLFPDGSYTDASAVLSFAQESALGAHVSGKSAALRDSSRAVLRHFVPVEKNGAVAAMLYGVIDLGEITELFQVNVYDGNASLYLADIDTGDILMDTYHSSLGTLDMLRSRKMADGYDIDAVIADVMAGNSGKFVSVSQSTGDYFFAYYQPAGINHWHVMLTVPEPIVMRLAARPTSLLILLAIIYAVSFLIYGLTVSRIYRRFVNMFINTPAGICVLRSDENLSILQANREFYRIMMLDKTDKKDIPDNLIDMLREDDQKAILRAYQKNMSSNQSTNRLELRVTDPFGEQHDIMAAAYYDEKDTRHITVNMIDITERKRMEDEMRLLGREYQIALSMSKRQVVTFDVQRKRATQLPGIVNLLRLEQYTERFPDMFIEKGLVEPSSIQAFNDYFAAIYRGDEHGEAYINMRAIGETEYHWFHTDFVNILDEAGKPVRAILSAYDATEQRTRELAYSRLQQSIDELPLAQYKAYERNLTRDIVESASGNAFISGRNIPFGEASAVIKKAIAESIYPEHAAALSELVDKDNLIKAYRLGVQPSGMEFMLRREENVFIWFSLHIQLIEDSFSGDIKAYYLFRDIDRQKRKELQSQLDLDRLKTELENSRIKVMINQMQPHFLYNALLAIQTIVKTDPEYASRLIYDFTIHLRSSIRALSSDEPIPFKDELKNIKAYLNIEQMRFGAKLHVNYEIDCDSFYVIPLSIQPLAENAARHGVYPKGNAGGTVTIRSYETEDAYVVEVEDDGMGFDVNEALNRKSDSVGLKSLIFRLKSLMNATVNIDSVPGRGTKATVTIPQ